MTRPGIAQTHPGHAGQRADDSGFTIVEVIVAIALVTIVMTSLAAFFTGSARATDMASQRQTAVQVAADAIDSARALTGVGLVSGRDKTSSDAQWSAGLVTTAAARYPGVAAYLSNVAEAYDGSVTSGGANAQLSTAGNIETLDSVDYTQSWFLGYCYSSQSVNSGACQSATASGLVQYIQVVVDVTWANKGCRNQLCSFVTATRVSPTPDPLFDESRTAPKPRIANPGSQVNDIGQAVSLAVSMSGGTAPITWSAPSGLPDGITPTYPSGSSTTLILAGTPTSAGTYSVLLTLSDGFGFTSTAKFVWTIYAPPSVTLANDKMTETAVENLAVPYTCPYAPCTITLASSVPGVGLKISAPDSGDNTSATSLNVSATSGTVYLTGTVQTTAVTGSLTSKVYTPKLTISDSGSYGPPTTSASWTVYVVPTVTVQSSTFVTGEGAAPSFAVTYNCYNGPCTIRASGLVPGVGLDDQVDMGSANSTTTLTVPTGSGGVYLDGLVSGNAVSDTATTSAQTYTTRLTVTDGDQVAGTDSSTWTARVSPTIGWPGDVTVARNAATSQAFSYSCYQNCRITLSGAPSGIGLKSTPSSSAVSTTTASSNSSSSGTLYLTGRASSAATGGTVTLTVTDSLGTVTSTGTWTVTT